MPNSAFRLPKRSAMKHSTAAVSHAVTINVTCILFFVWAQLEVSQGVPLLEAQWVDTCTP